jgi:hypothetical protein
VQVRRQLDASLIHGANVPSPKESTEESQLKDDILSCSKFIVGRVFRPSEIIGSEQDDGETSFSGVIRKLFEDRSPLIQLLVEDSNSKPSIL